MTLTLSAIIASRAAGSKRRTGREGRSLESLIVQSQTTVLLTKIPLSARRLGHGKIIPIAGPVDFFGCFRADGRIIVFDAKQTKNLHRLPTGKKQLHEHQRLEIVRYGEAGAVAGVANSKLYFAIRKIV